MRDVVRGKLDEGFYEGRWIREVAGGKLHEQSCIMEGSCMR